MSDTRVPICFKCCKLAHFKNQCANPTWKEGDVINTTICMVVTTTQEIYNNNKYDDGTRVLNNLQVQVIANHFYKRYEITKIMMKMSLVNYLQP